MNDYRGTFETLTEALVALDGMKHYDWAQIACFEVTPPFIAFSDPDYCEFEPEEPARLIHPDWKEGAEF